MFQQTDVQLDDIDLKILREMEADGRQPVSTLAKKLGISRAYAGKRLQSLLDRKITSIVAFVNPRVLGFRTTVMISIQASLGELHKAANRLRSLPNVHLAMIAAGRYNIVVWAMFTDPMDLSLFLTRDLGNIPGIKSAETTMILERRKTSFSYLASSDLVQRNGVQIQQPLTSEHSGMSDLDIGDVNIDQLDLLILRELETDGRQSVSNLAKKLGTSRAHMSSRLQRLLNRRIVRVVAHTSPLTLGYRIFAMIGIKVLPGDINTIADKLGTLHNVYGVAIAAGQHDIIIWTMFPTPPDLAAFLERDLGSIQGIISAECTILLELRKMSFPFLACSHLGAREETKSTA